MDGGLLLGMAGLERVMNSSSLRSGRLTQVSIKDIKLHHGTAFG